MPPPPSGNHANLEQHGDRCFSKGLSATESGWRRLSRPGTGDTLNLSSAFPHPVAHKMPAGVKVETPTQTEIVIKGCRSASVRWRPKLKSLSQAGAPWQGGFAMPTKIRPQGNQEEVGA